MGDVPYKFSIKIGNFHFEVEGDKNFVERTLTRYEGRFLPRFQQLMDKIPAVEQKPVMAPDEGQHHPAQNPTQKQENIYENERSTESRKENKRNRRRAERRRNNSRHSNNRIMPAPQVAPSQEVIKQPYIPPHIEEPEEPQKNEEKAIIPFPVPLVSENVLSDVDSPPPALDKAAQQDAIRVQDTTEEHNESLLEENKEETKEHTQEEGDSGALKELYEKLNPKTHHERVMVFGYFLQVQRGMKEFGTSRLKSCYRLVGAEPAGNINQVLNHASRTGFINKLQRGRSIKYSLTSKGRQFIERELNHN